MSEFKTQLKKAYDYYPILQMARMEQHQIQIIKDIKSQLNDCARGGFREFEDGMTASHLAHVVEFCRENDLEIKTEEIPVERNEALFKVKIWGWGENGDGHSLS